ncbi:MAG: glycosyltransferase family 4 protein [Terriglobia bacterium]|jgi:glycosyltransferase involved in cell wall biosynthesis
MKALILATDIYTRGGIARYTYTFASALADLLGPENVHVLALLGGGDPSDFHPRFRLLGPVSDRLTAGAKVEFARKALALARNKYDLIVCNHVSLALVAAVMRFVYRTPFWVVCHGREVWGRVPLLKRIALRQANLVLPISRFTAEKLSEVQGIPRGRVSILHNAVPSDFERLLTAAPRTGASEASLGNKGSILLSVGNLATAHAYKGFDTVIRALSVVLRRVPNVTYVIVGDGDDRPRLEKLTAEQQLESHVTFAGCVSDGQLARYYRSCDVFVLPSKAAVRNGNWEGEGFGRVYVEAALAGKPVVGSIGGGAAEALLDGKTGLLVDPLSVDEVAHGVITLLGDAGLAGGMGAAGRKWAMENFTEEALRRRLAELLQLDSGAEACRS